MSRRPMAAERLSAASRRFLVEDIESVMQLELVLLLHRDGGLAWSSAAASRELRAPQPWVETQLARFVQRGLAETTPEDDPRYRFDSTGPLVAVVDDIAGCWSQWRTSIIGLIHRARPADRRE
jgi:hypothetical protein